MLYQSAPPPQLAGTVEAIWHVGPLPSGADSSAPDQPDIQAGGPDTSAPNDIRPYSCPPSPSAPQKSYCSESHYVITTTSDAGTQSSSLRDDIIIPDACADIILRWRTDGTGTVHEASLDFIGTMTRAIRPDYARWNNFAGIRFAPAAAFGALHCSMRDLHDSCTDIKEALRDASKAQQTLLAQHLNTDLLLRNSPSPALAAKRLAQAVATCTSRLSTPAPEILSASIHLLQQYPSARLEKICKHLCTTPRTLHRLFMQHAGTNPKQIANVMRLQKALSFVRHYHKSSLVQAALHAGYADQAHFSRDCMKLCGMPPSSLFIS